MLCFVSTRTDVGFPGCGHFRTSLVAGPFLLPIRYCLLKSKVFIEVASAAVAAMASSELETQLLASINETGSVADSGEWAQSRSVDHLTVVGLVKSLQASEMITVTVSLLSGVREPPWGRLSAAATL